MDPKYRFAFKIYKIVDEYVKEDSFVINNE